MSYRIIFQERDGPLLYSNGGNYVVCEPRQSEVAADELQTNPSE